MIFYIIHLLSQVPITLNLYVEPAEFILISCPRIFVTSHTMSKTVISCNFQNISEGSA